jgi:DNA-binding GntR family transcriptional regulator
MRTSHEEHTEVYMAIVTGDGELAAKLLKDHIIVQGERFADLISTL